MQAAYIKRLLLTPMLLIAAAFFSPVSTASGTPELDLGTWHGCAFYPADGNVNCWVTHPNPSLYGLDQDYLDGDAIAFSSGDYDACVVKTDGNTQCWGYMASIGKDISYSGGDAVQVAVGYANACLLTDSGNVKCVGDYVAGTDTSYVDIYTGGLAEFVVLSSYAACFKTSDSELLQCRGWNVREPLWQVRDDASGVDNSPLPAAGGHYSMCILTAEGNGDCMDSSYNEVGQTSLKYTGGDAIDLDAQFDKSCVVTSRGTVECWGRKQNVQNFHRWTIAEASDGIKAGTPVNVSVGALAGGVYDVCWIDAAGIVECVYGQADDYGNGVTDSDGDGVDDEIDNCPNDYNEFQEDLDADGLGDVCDADIDNDGVDNDSDNCPTVVNPDQSDLDADGAGDPCDDDVDGDGISELEEDDLCPGTVRDPEAGVPSSRLGKNRWADLDGNGVFDTNGNNPTGRHFLMADTAGCSCAQIIAECGYGDGHSKHGCSNSVMDWWTGLFDRAGEAAFQCKPD